MTSTKLYFQDDAIQLIEIASSQENVSNVETSASILKLKKKNKIHTPPPLSPAISHSSSNNVSDLFMAKQGKAQLPPVPKPRTIKPTTKEKTTSSIPENLRNTLKASENIQIDNHSVQSLRSDTISYKERLRNRFLSVKRQAGSSVTQTPVSKVSSSRKSKQSIKDDFLNEENNKIENELMKRQSQTSKDLNDFNFFCKEFVKDDEFFMESTDDEDEKQDTDLSQAEETDKHYIQEFLSLDIRDTNLVETVPPEIIDIVEYEQEFFWTPTGKNYELYNDLDMTEIRRLEDEGIYKGEEPNIPNKELNLLKERLIGDKERQWFGWDGHLKILPDPRINTSFKPFKCQNFPKSAECLVTKSIQPKLYQISESHEIFSKKCFEINLYSIKFHHHPLFSAEHILAQKLNSFYEEYAKRKSENKYSLLKQMLDALIFAKRRIETSVLAMGDNVNTLTSRIERHISEIKEVRIKMYKEGKIDRELIKNILKTWKGVKHIRHQQKYQNTSLKLLITKEYDDYYKENDKWNKAICEEVSELVSECEIQFKEKLKMYKNELKEWKIKKKDSNENEELPERPSKPEKTVDVEKIQNLVTEKCFACLKPPGEPYLEFELINDEELLNKETDDSKEMQRRISLSKTQFFFKIMFNKIEVCKSKCIFLNNDFHCEFNDPISIQICSIPKHFTLYIYEQIGSTNKHLLHEINLVKLDGMRITEIKTDQFLKDDILHYSHTGVGSGKNINEILKPYDLYFEDEDLYTTGEINWNAGWNPETMDTNLNCAAIQNIQPNCTASAISNLENISDWLQNYSDPQDPQNAFIYDYIKSMESNTDDTKDYFRIEPDYNPFEFCQTSDIENNLRFKMLGLRDRNEPEFHGLVVPNRVKEITGDVFESYEKRCVENQSNVLIEDFDNEDIDGQRKWGAKHLQQAENKVIQLSKIAENKISLKDVICEDTIPTIGSLGLTFMNWLQPNRPLRPTRKTPKIIPPVFSMKEAKIIINIVGAIQVPIRRDMDTLHSVEQLSMVPVRPFVVATFKNKQARTTVAEGANPIWNQELTLCFENKNESYLQNLKGTLDLHLYDETVSDLIEDDRIRLTNIHQQLGYNWLGGLNFPISTLLYNNRIEGTFKLNSPPILLGYDNNTLHLQSEQVTHRSDTYLTVFITIQPAITRTINVQPFLECIELQYVEEYIKLWESEYHIQFPHRQFSSFVTNMNGEMSCVTRYFKGIEPPILGPDTEITEEQCVRFVSMIPFKQLTIFDKIPSIWLTAEQLLTLTLGSVTDHAVLLTCYFMALGIRCWLLLGYGIPYGYTSYVLIRETNSLRQYMYFIYDVETACKYSVQDHFCPMQKVFCVVNDENVWANIQVEERAHMTKFDFSRTSDWLHLFGKTVSTPVSTVQKLTIMYIATPSPLYLQERIEQKLRQKIMKWRKHKKTIWNHYCGSVLKQMLPTFESDFLHGNAILENPEELTELRNLFNSYKVEGFAMCFPYVTLKQLVEFVRATGIHCNENSDTEFALGVYVHPYPNYVLSVWIYLATIVRRR